MRCATHPDRDAAGYCRTCGRPLCPECKRDVQGVLYCESCLAAVVASAPPAAHGGLPSPGAAAGLGFIPGLGAIYNGEYVKGLVHIAIFAGIIAILNNGQPSTSMEAFFVIGLICFYFYMPIEAYRTARMKQAAAFPAAAPRPAASEGPIAGTASGPASVMPPDATSASFAGPAAASFAGPPGAPVAPGSWQPAPHGHFHTSPASAFVLIALGVLILLANLGLLSSEWFGRWWPLILIALGGWLLWRRFQDPARNGGRPS